MTLPEIVILILLVAVLILLVVLLFVLLRKNKEKEEKDPSREMYEYLDKMISSNNTSLNDIKDSLQQFKDQSSKDIRDSYANLLSMVTSQLNTLNQRMEDNLKSGFETNTNSMKEVSLALGQITKAQQNLDSLKDEVTSLNQILSNSQQRGRYGEVALDSLLHNVYGDTHGLYEIQYVMDDKTRPDAIVYLPKPDNMVCIDSKFSFTSYALLFETHNETETHDLRISFRQALKSQITKIATDYIKPGKTANYAIMFIPSDGIYAFLQSDEDFYSSIILYARSKNVILTSPSTLQPILANIRMLQVNYEVANNIRNIIIEIEKLRKENEKFAEDWSKFSTSLDSLTKKKEDFTKRVEIMNKKTDQLLNQADKDNLLPPRDTTTEEN